MNIDNDLPMRIGDVWKRYPELFNKYDFQMANRKLISYKSTMFKQDGERHWETGNDATLPNEEPQWETRIGSNLLNGERQAGNDTIHLKDHLLIEHDGERHWETRNNSILSNGEHRWEPTIDISKHPILFPSQLIFLLLQITE